MKYKSSSVQFECYREWYYPASSSCLRFRLVAIPILSYISENLDNVNSRSVEAIFTNLVIEYIIVTPAETLPLQELLPSNMTELLDARKVVHQRCFCLPREIWMVVGARACIDIGLIR